MDNKVKYIIDYGVEKYYSRHDCLHSQTLEYWKEDTYNDEKIKNIQPSTPLPDIARIVADKFNKIIEDNKKIEKEEDKVAPPIQELFKEDNKTTITKEKPKINTISRKNNKGVAVVLSIITGILVVIGMILVTLISYTIIK